MEASSDEDTSESASLSPGTGCAGGGGGPAGGGSLDGGAEDGGEFAGAGRLACRGRGLAPFGGVSTMDAEALLADAVGSRLAFLLRERLSEAMRAK